MTIQGFFEDLADIIIPLKQNFEQISWESTKRLEILTIINTCLHNLITSSFLVVKQPLQVKFNQFVLFSVSHRPLELQELYLFREIGKSELDFPNHKFVQFNICINEWLGEPVPVFQLPGRGILRNFINNLVINNFENQYIEPSM